MISSEAIIIKPDWHYSLENGTILHFKMGQNGGTYGLQRTGQILWVILTIVKKL
jgi:hypothetical protein